MQSLASYRDILDKIQQNWKVVYPENQYGYSNNPLYNLILFLRDNDVPLSEEIRRTVNDILTKANSGNVFDVTAEDIVLIVEQINKSIYSSVTKENERLFGWQHKPVKSFFYQSDFVNNLLFSFVSSTSNNNKINGYSSCTAQTAMCVKKLMDESEDDNLFYGKHKNDLIDALDLPERDNAAALCHLMYQKNLSAEDALLSIKDILKSVMEYKFKDKKDFISIAYCQYFCAQIDKLQLNNEFNKKTNQIVDGANSFFGKDFVPDFDKIKEFLPEFKMPDRYISVGHQKLLESDMLRNSDEGLVANDMILASWSELKAKIDPKLFSTPSNEEAVSAWESHYEKLIEFYDAFQTKDVELSNNLSSGQKDYVFLCKKAEIFKAVLEQCCKKEDTSIKRVEYNYDNIQVVNNVTQKIITTLKSNNDNEKNVIFGLVDLFVSDKQTADIEQLQIIDKILSEDSISEGSCTQIGNLKQNIKLTTLTSVKSYFETKATDLESQYKNGSTKDFDKAVSDFLTTSKNDLKALEYLVQKGIIKQDAYEQYKTKLNDATDLNCIITALYWFVNLLGAAISLGQWKVRVRAVKSPEKVRIFNRIPKSLDIESDKNEDLHQ